ncbi:MAG: TIGR04255 family protein [candidate division Zixibacteria bacterium]|nr:TIGR04255 family protein [candidate division Zixibacteria bacterium]
MKRKYRKSPIIEAVCEFRFDDEKEWDLTAPGLIYNQIKREFPNKRQKQQYDLQIGRPKDEIAHKIEKSGITQFVSNDENNLIQLGEHFITINTFSPYNGWDNYLPKIDIGLQSYFEIINPTKIKRIGLRYINKLPFEKSTVELKDYFQFYPNVGDSSIDNYSSFITGIQLPHENSIGTRDITKVMLNSLEEKKQEGLIALLDIDHFTNIGIEIDISKIKEWLNSSHSRVIEIFEACIKDSLREKFELIKE